MQKSSWASCMDVGLNDARMGGRVKDGHFHDGSKGIRMRISVRWKYGIPGGNMETTELLQYLRFREVQKILDELLHKRMIDPVIYDMVLQKYQRICSQHVV